MTSGSLCSAAALGSPCRCSGLTATLPRLCRPNPDLVDTLPPDPLRLSVTGYDIINDIQHKWNIAKGNFTSGAIRSRNRKGRFRSNILIRSPVRCFPV